MKKNQFSLFLNINWNKNNFDFAKTLNENETFLALIKHKTSQRERERSHSSNFFPSKFLCKFILSISFYFSLNFCQILCILYSGICRKEEKNSLEDSYVDVYVLSFHRLVVSSVYQQLMFGECKKFIKSIRKN